jgi:excisionase family DNA binding protein
VTPGQIVVVHGPADPSLDSVLERGGLRPVMRMDHMAVWVHDRPGHCPSPAAVAGPPAAPGGPQRLLLTVVQAAGVLGVGRTTTYQLIRAGQLEVVHVGRSVRVPADALPDLVRRLRFGRQADGAGTTGAGSSGAGWSGAGGTGAGWSRPDGTIRAVAPGDGSQRPAARTA